MKRQLEKIRTISDSRKKQIGFFAALAFTGVVIVVWLLLLTIDREKQKVIQQQNPPSTEESSEVGPLEFLDQAIESGRDQARSFQENRDVGGSSAPRSLPQNQDTSSQLDSVINRNPVDSDFSLFDLSLETEDISLESIQAADNSAQTNNQTEL